MKTIIGTCGNCGGPVVAGHPLGRCLRCKAIPLEQFGPKIEMQQKEYTRDCQEYVEAMEKQGERKK